MNKRILIEIFGAMRINDETTRENYLVRWIIELYTVQENTAMIEVEPQRFLLLEKSYVMLCFAMLSQWQRIGIHQ